MMSRIGYMISRIGLKRSRISWEQDRLQAEQDRLKEKQKTYRTSRICCWLSRMSIIGRRMRGHAAGRAGQAA